MFQSAVKTSKGVSAFKNWTPFWGIGCMESLHTVHQPVSEYDIKIGIQKVLLDIIEKFVEMWIVIMNLNKVMNLGLTYIQ